MTCPVPELNVLMNAEQKEKIELAMLIHTIVSKPAVHSKNVGNVRKLAEEAEFPIVESPSDNHAQGVDTLKAGHTGVRADILFL